MAKIPNGEVGRATIACRALIEYGHPITKAGLPLPVQIKLMRLEKLLRERAKELGDLREARLRRFGYGAKPDRDDDSYPDFRDEDQRDALAESDVPDELMVSTRDLRVRDESQELADIECPMTVYLGPLLIVEEASAANGNGKKPRPARSGKAKGKRPAKVEPGA